MGKSSDLFKLRKFVHGKLEIFKKYGEISHVDILDDFTLKLGMCNLCDNFNEIFESILYPLIKEKYGIINSCMSKCSNSDDYAFSFQYTEQ
jgi:hypothetical protein